jgi:hypothetical protein
LNNTSWPSFCFMPAPIRFATALAISVLPRFLRQLPGGANPYQ